MTAHHPIHFTVTQSVPLDAATAYALLCDWDDHGRWVPFTKMVVHSPDSFVAYTGIGPVKLEDNMEVTHRDDVALSLAIVKTGPVITGTASFTVIPVSASSSTVQWHEALTIPYLPALFAPVAAAVGKVLFAQALRRLAPR